MKTWVSQILVPYWSKKMIELNSPNQECFLQIDAWKVHRSKEFRGWMQTEYPWIVIEFIPGGCTGLWQPCDIGIQRPFKLALKRCQQEDLVQATLSQLKAGVNASEIKIDTTIGTLRDAAVNWLVTAYHHVNKPDIVRQVGFLFISALLVYRYVLGI